MENASKALIIAGAILLSISIIALGVFALNSVSSTIPDEPLKDVEIQQFNSKFQDYEGESVSGSRVKALLNALRSHNIGQEDTSKRVGLNLGKVNKDRDNIATTDIATALADIKAGKTYVVALGYDEFSGLVNMITITDKK